jgi:hypothetical protein
MCSPVSRGRRTSVARGEFDRAEHATLGLHGSTISNGNVGNQRLEGQTGVPDANAAARPMQIGTGEINGGSSQGHLLVRGSCRRTELTIKR